MSSIIEKNWNPEVGILWCCWFGKRNQGAAAAVCDLLNSLLIFTKFTIPNGYLWVAEK